MRTIVMQEVNNGYLVQVHESRMMWNSECHAGNPYVYRNLDDFVKDVYKLFGKTEPATLQSPSQGISVKDDYGSGKCMTCGGASHGIANKCPKDAAYVAQRCMLCGKEGGHNGMQCPLSLFSDVTPK